MSWGKSSSVSHLSAKMTSHGDDSPPHRVILKITQGDRVRALENKIMPYIGMFVFPGHKPTVSEKRLVVCGVGKRKSFWNLKLQVR